MERVERIRRHELFSFHLEKNEAAETERRFCRHNMAHFLDVARIGALMNVEEGLGVCKEWIYAAALLHDLGKHIQYEDGAPHERASAAIAPQILRDCGFTDKEADVIISAIRTHRDEKAAENELGRLLYRADKASRACYACGAEADCNWDQRKKNLRIRY